MIWLTGLSGSGKTTIGRILANKLNAVHLDGDVMRRTVCADLGYSPEDRAENVDRSTTVAHYLSGAGPVVCSFITPLESMRGRVKARLGDCLMVYVQCSLEECERRDPKGLYARARSGELSGFTGVDSPFDYPSCADLEVCSEALSPQACANLILGALCLA